MREVPGAIFLALGFALLLMYLILVMQFGGFLDQIAILPSLPISVIGVVLTLLVIPTIYEVLMEWRSWAIERLRRFRN